MKDPLQKKGIKIFRRLGNFSFSRSDACGFSWIWIYGSLTETDLILVFKGIEKRKLTDIGFLVFRIWISLVFWIWIGWFFQGTGSGFLDTGRLCYQSTSDTNVAAPGSLHKVDSALFRTYGKYGQKGRFTGTLRGTYL